VVNAASGSSLDRNEEQVSGPRRSSVEPDKEGDGFVRLRWGETKEQDAVGGACLTIEIGAEFPIGIMGYVDKFTVFDILGNRYRLICVIHYNRGKVLIRHVLSLAEYDCGRWKRE
jgi:hypothetical protein